MCSTPAGTLIVIVQALAEQGAVSPCVDDGSGWPFGAANTAIANVPLETYAGRRAAALVPAAGSLTEIVSGTPPVVPGAGVTCDAPPEQAASATSAASAR